MPDLILELDAAGSNIDGTNPGSALVITTGSYALTSFDPGSPSFRHQWVSNADSEGAGLIPGQPDNRTLRIGLDVTGDAALYALEGKLGKLHREGGTLKYTTPAADVVTFDVLAHADYLPLFDQLHYLGGITQVTFSLVCDPYGRGAEVDLGDNVETSLPALVFSESVPGAAPALIRAVIDNDSTANWDWVVVGAETDAEYTHTASTGSAGLFYEAESRTPLGAATTAVGPAGASGAGSNTVTTSQVVPRWQSILSTQASGGGAHLTHVGPFHVFARVFLPGTMSGDLSFRLEWSTGDFQQTTINPPATYLDADQRAGTWVLADLGTVQIDKVTQGTHRWEGRVAAHATWSQAQTYIDFLMLVPASVAYAEATALVRYETPSSFTALDSFDQTAGNLTGKTALTGGVWAGAGDADDFTIDTTNDRAQRTAVSDTVNTGRYAISGASAMTAMTVEADFSWSADTTVLGILARYVDANNWFMLGIEPNVSPTQSFLRVYKKIAGSLSVQAGVEIDQIDYNTTNRLRLQVDADGVWFAWFNSQSSVALADVDTDLATGGTLASGKPGFYDEQTTATAATRTVDNFAAWVPTSDAAVYAGQSFQITHRAAERENSAGTHWGNVGSFRGSRFRVPPAGAEGRSLRVIVKPCRLDPRTMSDTGVDDVSARLFAIPRYLNVPEP